MCRAGGRRCPGSKTYKSRKSIQKCEESLKNAGDNSSDPRFDKVRNTLFRNKKKLSSGEDQAPSLATPNSVVEDASTPDGGATVSPTQSQYVTSGFAYSPYPERSLAVNAQDLSADTVKQYMKDNNDLLSKEGHNLGVWHDPETHVIYLDISVTTESAILARKQCLKTDQIAFFDMQTFESVDVDRGAKSGQGKEGEDV